eukprot:gene21454-biopygen7129
MCWLPRHVRNGACGAFSFFPLQVCGACGAARLHGLPCGGACGAAVSGSRGAAYRRRALPPPAAAAAPRLRGAG